MSAYPMYYLLHSKHPILERRVMQIVLKYLNPKFDKLNNTANEDEKNEIVKDLLINYGTLPEFWEILIENIDYKLLLYNLVTICTNNDIYLPFLEHIMYNEDEDKDDDEIDDLKFNMLLSLFHKTNIISSDDERYTNMLRIIRLLLLQAHAEQIGSYLIQSINIDVLDLLQQMGGDWEQIYENGYNNAIDELLYNVSIGDLEYIQYLINHLGIGVAQDLYQKLNPNTIDFINKYNLLYSLAQLD